MRVEGSRQRQWRRLWQCISSTMSMRPTTTAPSTSPITSAVSLSLCELITYPSIFTVLFFSFFVFLSLPEYCGFEYDLDRCFPSEQKMRFFLKCYLKQQQRQQQQESRHLNEDDEDFVDGFMVGYQFVCLLSYSVRIVANQLWNFFIICMYRTQFAGRCSPHTCSGVAGRWYRRPAPPSTLIIRGTHRGDLQHSTCTKNNLFKQVYSHFPDRFTSLSKSKKLAPFLVLCTD